MDTEKLTCMIAIKKLSEYRGSQSDAAVSAKIDHVCYIIEHLSDDEVDKINSLRVLLNRLDNTSRTDNVNDFLSTVLNDLKKIKLSDTYKATAIGQEVNKYTGNAKKRHVASILFWTVILSGVVVAAILAFLDNFKVIDYGGVVAGAVGIIDFIIGAVGFAVERISDSKVTSCMKTAENVHDSESYKVYINNSFHHISIIDKRRYGGKG